MSLPRYASYKNWEDPVASIPSHWAVSKLHSLASINDDTLPEDIDPSREIEYVDIGSVSLGRGIHQTQQFAFSSAPSRARRLVREGDIIVSTVRTYLKAIAPIGQGQDHLVVSTGFAVVRPKAVLASGFAKYALQSPKFVDDVISRSTGVSYPAINASDLARIDVPTPPAEEQVAIAAFLDRETAKIDALIAEQERLLELLAEKRQAVISHAVTKGLNPDAPMKDSGVAWLGEVPAHWNFATFQRCVRVQEGQVDPERAPYRDMLMVAPNHVESRTGRILYQESAAEQAAESGKYLCKAGDVIYSKIRPALRKVCIAPCECLCSADMYPLRGDDRLRNSFLRWFMLSESFSAVAVLESERVAMPKINRDSLKAIWLPLPPLHEQEEIDAALSSVARQIDVLSGEAERVIALLHERRSALIAAAVTGQVDVREAA